MAESMEITTGPHEKRLGQGDGFSIGTLPADLAALRSEVEGYLERDENPPVGLVRGLLEDNIQLQKRVNAYEEQRRMVVAIMGSTGMLSSRKALKESRLRKFHERLELDG